MRTLDTIRFQIYKDKQQIEYFSNGGRPVPDCGESAEELAAFVEDRKASLERSRTELKRL